jgi:ABC-2 type transport system permease protein
MRVVSHWLPLTHAVQAARRVAAGDQFASVSLLLLREAGLVVLFLAVGVIILVTFERESRRSASLERQ